MAEVGVFLGFIAVVWVIGMIVEYWEIILPIVLILVLAFFLHRADKEYKKQQAEDALRAQRLVEEKQKEEKERQAQIATEKAQLKASIQSAFETTDYNSLIAARGIVEGQKHHRGQVSQNAYPDFTVSEIKSYLPNITELLERTLRGRDYNTAINILDFLIFIDAATSEQRVEKENIEDLVGFLETGCPSIVSKSQYGKFDRAYAEWVVKTPVFDDPGNLMALERPFADLIWGLTLHRPHDPYLHGTFLKEFWSIKRDKPICNEILASAIVLRACIGLDASMLFIPSFNDELKLAIDNSSTNSVVLLASVAAAVGNFNDEFLILSLIIERTDFPGSLLDRYNFLSDRNS